ncbi:hypothetical protein [Streptomyces sp. HC307]|uniref:hypothetical protein n=1 Tax=Streptomyces flavusporus TaxID=3385496 RepID=UPI003917645B
MRKYQKAAVVLAMLGSVSFLGVGVGHADDGHGKGKFDNKQFVSCEQNDWYQGLVEADEVLPISAGALIGFSHQDNSDKEFQHCGNSFGK